MKIGTAAKEYLIEIEVRKFTPKTIRSYRNNLNLFLRFCEEEAGIAEIENVSLAVVRQFSRFMSERGRKGSYINGLLKVAKAFIQYCYEEGYGGFNTRKNFKWCKQDKAVILAFSVADVRQMLRSCKGCDFMQIRDAAILTMLFETGIRCWELCCIQKQDIHDDFIIINGKNHKQRVVPVTPVLRKAMLRYLGIDCYSNFLDGTIVLYSSLNGQGNDDLTLVRLSPDDTEPTFGQKNALSSAESYLAISAFSHSKLIQQLEYEGYSSEEATYAADRCGANWCEQAAKSAEAYLKISAFSKDRLIQQLEYEGFTPAQAAYGVAKNGYLG